MVMVAGCSGGSSTDSQTDNISGTVTNNPGLPVIVNPPIPPDKFVFIRHWIHTNGEKEPGACCGGAVFGDPPGYLFSNGVLRLRDYYPNETNESMIMFYGGGGNLSGCAGMGENTWGSPVYSLPYTPHYPEREKNVTIESLSNEGIVILRYNQEQISLSPGETWSVNTTWHKMNKWNTRSQSGEIIPMNCTMKLVTVDSFYNAGILDKGTIVFI
jgi:hypothetical protein